MKLNVLLADDDESIRFVLGKFLTRAGYNIKSTDNPYTLLKWVKAGEGDVILTDVHMGTDEIFTFVPQLKSLRPELPIIVISANTCMVTALKSRQTGVFEYIPKPFDFAKLEKTIQRALDVNAPPKTDKILSNPDQMIGRSKAMQPVFKAISDYASGKVPVFISGEAGTGKNLTAKCLHDAGKRNDLGFYPFDRFADANDLIKTVKNGDVFVDRIHELNIEQQVLLLGILEENESRHLNEQFRIIAASEKTLDFIYEHQLVRSDLLSHLLGGKIFLPPLNERTDDLEELATHFLNSVRLGTRGVIKANALARLKVHSWPGNVRELKNLMHVIALQFSDTDISEDIINQMLDTMEASDESNVSQSDIKGACTDLLQKALITDSPSYFTPYEQALEWVEKPLITEALRLTGGNNSKAAKLLGIHRNTLRTKIRNWHQK